jgi:hypothetical protein
LKQARQAFRFGNGACKYKTRMALACGFCRLCFADCCRHLVAMRQMAAVALDAEDIISMIDLKKR